MEGGEFAGKAGDSTAGAGFCCGEVEEALGHLGGAGVDDLVEGVEFGPDGAQGTAAGFRVGLLQEFFVVGGEAGVLAQARGGGLGGRAAGGTVASEEVGVGGVNALQEVVGKCPPAGAYADGWWIRQ